MSITYPTAQRYINITSCSLGTTLGINTITKIAYSIKTKMIKGKGDADVTLSFLAKGCAEVDGTIELEDPVQAAALVSAVAGDFVFTGLNPATAKVLTVTIKGALFFDLGGSEVHDDIGKVTVTFSGFLATATAVIGSSGVINLASA